MLSILSEYCWSFSPFEDVSIDFTSMIGMRSSSHKAGYRRLIYPFNKTIIFLGRFQCEYIFSVNHYKFSSILIIKVHATIFVSSNYVNSFWKCINITVEQFVCKGSRIIKVSFHANKNYEIDARRGELYRNCFWKLQNDISKECHAKESR